MCNLGAVTKLVLDPFPIVAKTDKFDQVARVVVKEGCKKVWAGVFRWGGLNGRWFGPRSVAGLAALAHAALLCHNSPFSAWVSQHSFPDLHQLNNAI